MDVLRTAVTAALAAFDPDTEDLSKEANIPPATSASA